MRDMSDFSLERLIMVNSLALGLGVMTRTALASLLAFAMLSWFSVDAAFAHKPDRCFHTHNGGNTNCKSRVPGKRCSDADGNKGRCIQGARFCYCSIHKKSDESTGPLLDLGIAVGGAILEDKLDRRDRREHRRRRRERDRRDRDERIRD